MQDRYYHVNRRKYNLKAHIVLVTKYRKTLLQNDMSEFVKKAIDYLAKQNRWNIIGRNTHSGLMGTLLAALVKYHQKPSKSI